MVPPEPPRPTPIPVEGDVQIFADPECTVYADGTQATVYARVNVPWGYDGGWGVDAGRWSSMFMAPSPEGPDDPYTINLWYDFWSQDSNQPFSVGEILPITVEPSAQPVPDIVTIFYKP